MRGYHEVVLPRGATNMSTNEEVLQRGDVYVLWLNMWSVFNYVPGTGWDN